MYIWGTNWEKDYNIVLSMVSTKSEFDGEDGAKEKRVIFYLHKFDVRIFVTIRYHSYILVGWNEVPLQLIFLKASYKTSARWQTITTAHKAHYDQ